MSITIPAQEDEVKRDALAYIRALWKNNQLPLPLPKSVYDALTEPVTIKAPAECRRCNRRFFSPTTGTVLNRCDRCDGPLFTQVES